MLSTDLVKKLFKWIVEPKCLIELLKIPKGFEEITLESSISLSSQSVT